jgi:hypothetical protein
MRIETNMTNQELQTAIDKTAEHIVSCYGKLLVDEFVFDEHLIRLLKVQAVRACAHELPEGTEQAEP